MAVAIISQAVRDGGRGRDRQIRKTKQREHGGGRTRERSQRKEKGSKRERERDVHHTVSVTLSSSTYIMIPGKKPTPYRQRYTILKLSLTVL